MTEPQQNQTRQVSKIAFFLVPFVAFGKIFFSLIIFLVWKYLLNSASSDPSATPELFLKESYKFFFTGYFLALMVTYGVAFLAHKKEKYLVSTVLSILVIMGILFNSLVF